jgi:hypothetical protein
MRIQTLAHHHRTGDRSLLDSSVVNSDYSVRRFDRVRQATIIRFPAATDSRFLRALWIRASGFSPMRNTEILLHEHDEYILERNYLEGIGIYVELIQALGSQGDEMEELLSNNKRPAEQAATKKYSTRHTNAYLKQVDSMSILASYLSLYIFAHFIALSIEGNPRHASSRTHTNPCR